MRRTPSSVVQVVVAARDGALHPRRRKVGEGTGDCRRSGRAIAVLQARGDVRRAVIHQQVVPARLLGGEELPARAAEAVARLLVPEAASGMTPGASTLTLSAWVSAPGARLRLAPGASTRPLLSRRRMRALIQVAPQQANAAAPEVRPTDELSVGGVDPRRQRGNADRHQSLRLVGVLLRLDENAPVAEELRPPSTRRGPAGVPPATAPSACSRRHRGNRRRRAGKCSCSSESRGCCCR